MAEFEADRPFFTFESSGISEGDFFISKCSGHEGISQLMHFDLELIGRDSNFKFSNLLNQPACIKLRCGTRQSPSEHKFHGIICSFEQLTRHDDNIVFHAELVPRLWWLTLNYQNRIFQNKSVQDIVKEILIDASFQTDDFKFSLNGSYQAKEYCVQYGESDFNFISRLLEDAGIFYFFEYNESKDIIVFADAPSIHEETGPQHEVKYRDPTGLVPAEEETIYPLTFKESLVTGKITLRDFNYDTPQGNLMTSSQINTQGIFEAYHYPGGFQFIDQGNTKAKVRNEEIESTRLIITGRSDCRSFRTGYRYQLVDHYRDEFNDEYLLTKLQHTGIQSHEGAQKGSISYENTFECIPMNQPFRPARVTPKPRMQGTQTAIVVGPQGEQLYMDDSGRAKIQFHWDLNGQKNEKSSCWVRVSHGYAGKEHGIQFHPLVGDEVVVDFLEGDPDKPIITGRVYNGDNQPHLRPDDRIQNQILTPYQHKLIFDDQAKLLTLNTGGNQTLHMADGSDSDELGNHIKLSTADGHYALFSKGSKLKGIQIQTELGHTITFTDDPSPNIFIQDKSGNLHLTMDSDNEVIELINDGSAQVDVKCDNGKVNISATEINIDASSKVSITGGAEISLSAPEIKINGDSQIAASAPQVSIEGSAKLEQKGAQVSIEGSAQLEAKGAMVSINGNATTELKGGAMVNIQGALVKIN